MEVKESAASYIDYLETLSKKQLMVMLARARQEETQGIGIVGMGCRFPGDIDSPQQFWELLLSGQAIPTAKVGPPLDSLGQPRWNIDAPDLTAVAELLRSGAYLSNLDCFDADYFGISGEEACYMDPQQRLLLEVTVQALADANLTRPALQKRRVGIFVGSSFMEYTLAGIRNGMPPEAASPHMLQGNILSAASGRLGLMLGVNGPALSLDTASSSALTAIHLAAQALRRRECDVAIVGACHLLLSPFATAILAKTGVLSPTGKSRPFTNDADGHVRGEGCGVFVLKRYQDCINEGDQPYAMIRGSAVYQHGDRLALSVASGLGQSGVIEQALRNAGVGPLDVQYVEAQANGSRLGGVAEVETLAQAYGRQVQTAPPLYLGSCKANIGYMEVASGAAGLMKVALMLAHGEISPQPGATNLDSSISWNNMALRFANEPMAWPTEGRRLAGITGLGMNGINGHAILEGIPKRQKTAAAPTSRSALLVMSAHNEAALKASAHRLRQYLLASGQWDYRIVCNTLIQGREQHKFRDAEVIQNREQLLGALAKISIRTQPAEQISNQLGVFLSLTNLNDIKLRNAATEDNQGRFSALDALVLKYAEKMGIAPADTVLSEEGGVPSGAGLTWILGWLELLRALKIEVVGCTIDQPEYRAVLDLLSGHLHADQICAQWQTNTLANGSASYTGWDLSNQAAITTLQRYSGSRAMPPIKLASLDEYGWLSLVAEQYCKGANLDLPSLLASSTPAMMRLPGPVLTGKHYWPEIFKWK
jgi:3-oxoacyl-[acyl-carrier-protein] synthase II